jgi:holo-[acyl-carrier protein] synthase
VDIVGLGTEIVECLRIRRMIEDHGELFLMRVFTEQEVRFCQSRRLSTEHFASRWAAKEAVLKCLGTAGNRGSAWTDIVTESTELGAIKVIVHGGLREAMEQRGVTDVLLTTSFCRAYATATAIAVRG